MKPPGHMSFEHVLLFTSYNGNQALLTWRGPSGQYLIIKGSLKVVPILILLRLT